MIKLKKITPMFTAIITTADKYEGDSYLNSGLIDTSKEKGMLKEYQTVLAIGNAVRTCKVGDLVCINPNRYEVRKFGKDSAKEAMVETYNPVVNYQFNFIELEDQLCLRLQENDIDYIVDEYEEVAEVVPTESALILPSTKLILP